jgi:predicted enzyme related to lactoylglutathione lyase
MTNPAVAGEDGVRPDIYVKQIDDTLEKVAAHGGAVVDAPYPEGDLWVATF